MLTGWLALFAMALSGGGADRPPEARNPSEVSARIASLEKAYRAHPRDLRVLDALAGSYAMLGRFDAAARVGAEMLAIDPDRPGLRLRVARLYAWAEDYHRALVVLEAADPSDAAALETRCKVLSYAAKPEQAAACYERLLSGPDADRHPAEDFLAWARNLSWSGQRQAAIRAYERYLGLAGDDPHAQEELVALLLSEGGTQDLERALELRPRDIQVLDALAVGYARAAQFGKAAGIVEQMLGLEPARRDLRLRLANLHYWAGDYTRSLDALATMEPLDPPALQTRCQVLSEARRAKEAAACYGALLRGPAAKPYQSPGNYLTWARNLAWSQQRRAAIEAYRGYLEIAPNDRGVAKELVALLMAEGQVPDLELAYRLDPHDASVMDALAKAYTMAGQFEKAAGMVSEMLLVTPERADLRLRLANLYAWAGEYTRSLDALQMIQSPVPIAREARCRVLSEAGRARESALCYGLLLAPAGPQEQVAPEAYLGWARNLAWSHQSSQAMRAYKTYLRLRPENRAAQIELIRLLRYQGRFAEAERLCDDGLRQWPEDTELLALKSEILHWARYRAYEALQLANRALELGPNSIDARIARVYALDDLGWKTSARSGFRQVQSSVASQGGIPAGASFAGAYQYLEEAFASATRIRFETPYSVYDDSDGIHNVSSGIRMAIPIRDHFLQIAANRYTSSAPASSIFSTSTATSGRAFDIQAGGEIHLAAGTYAKGTVGQFSDSLWRGARPIFDAALVSSPFDRVSFEIGASRQFLALTPRALQNGIGYSALRLMTTYRIDSRTALSLAANRRYWTDRNSSFGIGGSVQRLLRYSHTFSIDGGLQFAIESFRQDMLLSSGYFSPDRYERFEGFAGAHGELGRRLLYELRLAAGAQQLARSADYRRSMEAVSSLTLRLNRVVGLMGSYQWRNYSLLYKDGWYNQLSVALTVQP